MGLIWSTQPQFDAQGSTDSRNLAATSKTVFSRSSRVLALLVIIWILSVFDLFFTVAAHQAGMLDELNPLARPFLDTQWGLVSLKACSLTAASVILLALRRHRLAEAACWSMSVIMTLLAVLWISFVHAMSKPYSGIPQF